MNNVTIIEPNGNVINDTWEVGDNMTPKKSMPIASSKTGTQSYSGFQNYSFHTHPGDLVVVLDNKNLWAGARTDLDFEKEPDWILDGSGMLKVRPFIEQGPDELMELNRYAEGSGKFGNAKIVLFDWLDGAAPGVHPAFWKDLWEKFGDGEDIVCTCFGGHGRTGTMLAAFLIAISGLETDEAVIYVREHYCDSAVETGSQISYLDRCDKYFNGRTQHEMKVKGSKTGTASTGSSFSTAKEPIKNPSSFKLAKELEDDIDLDDDILSKLDSYLYEAEGEYTGLTVEDVSNALKIFLSLNDDKYDGVIVDLRELQADLDADANLYISAGDWINDYEKHLREVRGKEVNAFLSATGLTQEQMNFLSDPNSDRESIDAILDGIDLG